MSAQGAYRLPLARVDRSHEFETTLEQRSRCRLTREAVTTLQVNVGKVCNQACHHCHVEAGPKRTESMQQAVAERVIDVLEQSPTIDTVDITGGAPELNPSFRYLVKEARRLGKQVIDRCNLTILFEPGMEGLIDFLAEHQVRMIASLPCYQATNVDKQRGRGVFDKSIAAIAKLNASGFGKAGSGLGLDLVYNPVGASLPPAQASLERAYKKELGQRFGLVFNRLLTLTNMPIRRFAHQLARDGEHETYMSLLVNHFNPDTVSELMCRSLVSVGWDGKLYDCDFNQMLELPLGAEPKTIWEIESVGPLAGASITTGDHCFGCTAGAGSSCGGALD